MSLRMTRRARGPALAGAAAVIALLLAGCVGIPTGGAVGSAPIDLDDDGDPDVEIVGADRGGRIVGERLYVDSDGDGSHDVMLVDLDANGVADAAYDNRDPRFTRRGR